MIWQGSAPSNIALIKYMGKKDFDFNIPSNPSFSYTLDGLRSFVEIEKTNGNTDKWEPLKKENCLAINLSDVGQKRFLKHFDKIKALYQVEGFFILRSCNNFPSDSGLASSASSFAALTMVSMTAFENIGYKNKSGKKNYEISREGSGSSCRSFFSPWAIWNKEEVFSPELPISNLRHNVILINSSKKEVSSGEAHRRVETSLLFLDREKRALTRLDDLVEALRKTNWKEAYNICWAEFWDMHTLFHTSHPHFSYMSALSFEALRAIDAFWKKMGDGPLVTMDAGPNIHLLWREDQVVLMNKFTSENNFNFLF